MELPIIIAIPVAIVYFMLWVLFNIIREWWKMKNEQPRIVNEAERPAIVKPRKMYRGKLKL